MRNHPRKTPQTDAEWARNTERRLRSLEDARTLRVGQWVISDAEGALTATKPGAASLEVGQEPVEPVIADLTRGFVTPEEVTKVVTGGSPGPLAEAQTYLADKWNAFISTPQTVIGNIADVIMDGIESVGTFLNKLWTGLTGSSGTGKTISNVQTAASAVTSTANTASTNAATASANNVATNTAIYNGFYGSGGTGTSTEVLATVTDIKAQIAGGWTVQTITTSGTWTRPWSASALPKEVWAICISGGNGGGGGRASTSTGVDLIPGTGGDGGKYLSQQINPADITSTVSVTVGAGGSGGTGARQTGSPTVGSGGTGGTTSFGALASIAATAPSSSIASIFGYYDASTSGGGNGGTGRSSNGVTVATSGAATPLASGGASGGSSSQGSNGGDASLTGQTRAGGGGGGGGGSVYSGSAFRGGGNGGFPGGGGGGAGSSAGVFMSGQYAGNGGAGGNGVVILLWR